MANVRTQVPDPDCRQAFASVKMAIDAAEVAIVGLGGVAATVAMDDLTDADTTTIPPTLNDSLKWNGSQWVPAVYNYTFVFTVNTFADDQVSPQLIGLAGAVWKVAGAINFTATYNNGPPDSASIAMSGSGGNNWASPLTMTTPFAAKASAVDTLYPTAKDVTKTFTLTAIKGAVTDSTKTTTVVFNNYIWHGVSTVSASFTEANVEALANFNLSSTPTGSRALSAGAGQYLVLAYPASYSSMNANGFLYNSITCPMTLDSSTLSITNSAGFVEPYKVYVSTLANLGASNLVASTLDTRINPFYYGGSTLGTGWTASQIKALTGVQAPVTNNPLQTWNSVTLAASEYFVFAYPSRLSDPTNWFDNGTSFSLSLYAGSPETVSITNVNGFTENYDVWRSNKILGPGAFQLRTS